MITFIRFCYNLGTRQAVFLIAGRNALLSGSKDAFVFSAVK